MKWTDQRVYGVEFRGEGHRELQWEGESLCLGQGGGRIGRTRPSGARQGGGCGRNLDAYLPWGVGVLGYGLIKTHH